MASLVSDVRYAGRVLRKSPAFSLVAIAALALGIGANTAIFSVVSAVLLEPLPYPQPDRLVRAYRSYPVGRGTSVSIPKFMAWKPAQTLEAIAAHDFAGPGLNLEDGERPEQVLGIHATREYFTVLGATMALGRGFTAAEDRPGGPRVAVLTHGLWNARFGADPAIVGKSIRLSGEPFTVVGVLGERFVPTLRADLFMPLQADPNTTNHGHFLFVLGRLKPGVAIAAARAELRLLGENFRRQHPSWMSREESASVDAMQEADTLRSRQPLLVLLGAVGLVLLIACANVASLLLVRAAARQKEIAIRAAVGARRIDIVRQLLAESLLLSTSGALLGLLLGLWGTQALLAVAPETLPRVEALSQMSLVERVLDWRLLTFTAAAALLTGVIFGLAPAVHLARERLGAALQEGGRGTTSAAFARVRGALVITEVALAVVLLVGSALLIRTFASLRAVDLGFDSQNVLALQSSLAGARYSTRESLERLIDNVTRELATLPEIESAAFAASPPLQGGIELTLVIDGRPLPGPRSFHGSEEYRAVSNAYFDVLRIPRLRGRLFTPRDNRSGAPVMVVNAAFAKRYWPDRDAIGQRLTFGGGLGPQFQDVSREVVGIVSDVRERGPYVEAPPVAYVPAPQIPEAMLQFSNSLLPWSWMIRMRPEGGPPTAIIQQAFIDADQLPTSNVRTLEQLLSRSAAAPRFNMLLLTIFGAMAVVLAAIGIYGLMSYTVEQGTREIGVRVALGAARRDIVSMVLGRGMRLAAAGLVLGVVGALGSTRVLQRMLFGVQPTDPFSFASVTAALAAVAFFACYIPARRATRVDPIVALRSE